MPVLFRVFKSPRLSTSLRNLYTVCRGEKTKNSEKIPNYIYLLIPYHCSLANGICRFSPFQVIPHSKDELATNFSNVVPISDCFFENASAKFPDNAVEIKLQWLNKNYMEINSSGNELYFKVSKSTHYLECTIG